VHLVERLVPTLLTVAWFVLLPHFVQWQPSGYWLLPHVPSGISVIAATLYLALCSSAPALLFLANAPHFRRFVGCAAFAVMSGLMILACLALRTAAGPGEVTLSPFMAPWYVALAGGEVFLVYCLAVDLLNRLCRCR